MASADLDPGLAELAALRAAVDLERSARAEAEAALERCDELLRAIPVVVCACRGTDHMIEIVYGAPHYALSELCLGVAVREAFDGLGRKRWLEPMERALASGNISRARALPGSSGSECFFDVECVPRFDKQGRVYGVLLTAVEVTFHVYAELRLETAWRAAHNARRAEALQHERLSRALEQAPFGVAILEGPEQRLSLVNESHSRWLGAKPQLGLTMRQAYPEPEMTGLHDTLQVVFDSGQTLVMREQPLGWLSAPNSPSVRAVLDTVYQPIRSASGEAEAILAFSVDVSESVRARHAASCEAADAAREYLRNVLAAVPAAICVVTGSDLVFELVNPAYESLVPGRALIGRKVAEVFHEVTSDRHIERMQRVYTTGEVEYAPEVRACYDRELSGVASDAYFSTILGPLRKPDGSIIGVVAATLEVTQQVRLRDSISAMHNEAQAARHALQREKALLATRIDERSAQLAQTNRALAAEVAERTRAEAQLRELVRRLATAREDEQRRVARDLHDQVGQTLTALTLAVQAVRSDSTLSPVTHGRLTDLQQLADGLALEVHNLALRLRPTMLDDLGLQAAVVQLLSDFATRWPGSTDFQTAGLQLARLPSEVETVLYRVVQESITNVARHAQASHVTVIIESRQDSAIAIVEDDGIGCDPDKSATSARLGWLSMRERILSVGGMLDIESEPGRGTTVIANVPIGHAAGTSLQD